MNAKHSSKSVEHYTPADIVERARRTMRSIDLDPASCELANKTVKAHRYLTQAQDGLTCGWSGNVFLNPPGGKATPRCRFSRSSQVEWWAKLIEQWEPAPLMLNGLFIGFSLEFLQAAQAFRGWQPVDFPFCIPRKRICFDVSADELIERLRAEQENEHNPERYDRLKKKIADLEPLHGQLVTGDAPTHANVIVCVTADAAVARQFRENFEPLGRVLPTPKRVMNVQV